MISLDANNPNHVDNPRVIEADLGQPNRKMMIFSGIAMPAWIVNDDDHTYHEDCTVNLRRTVLAVDQGTVAVGPASFGNDETTFLIATDTGHIDVDPASQELLLKVRMALQGEHTGLMRFGYQVVVTVTTQATGISGTIRWRRELFNATGLNAGQIAQMFQIAANHVDRITPPQGFVYDKYTPVAFGVTKGLSHDDIDFLVPYEIPGAPYNQPLVVTVNVGPLFRSNGSPYASQTSGPNPVVLTVAQPGVTNVDFRVTATVLR
jgi:hypothetical protein